MRPFGPFAGISGLCWDLFEAFLAHLEAFRPIFGSFWLIWRHFGLFGPISEVLGLDFTHFSLFRSFSGPIMPGLADSGRVLAGVEGPVAYG